ncbi:MAG: hypothetical protein ACI9TA_003299, partial [Reinekea sp.]
FTFQNLKEQPIMIDQDAGSSIAGVVSLRNRKNIQEQRFFQTRSRQTDICYLTDHRENSISGRRGPLTDTILGRLSVACTT